MAWIFPSLFLAMLKGSLQDSHNKNEGLKFTSKIKLASFTIKDKNS
jgi:hypothetical protein